MAVLFHFFAIFLLAPFAFAEWVYRQETGKTRRGIWLAILCFPLVLVIMIPKILTAKHVYGGIFWSKPTTDLLTESYSVFMYLDYTNAKEVFFFEGEEMLVGHGTLREIVTDDSAERDTESAAAAACSLQGNAPRGSGP